MNDFIICLLQSGFIKEEMQAKALSWIISAEHPIWDVWRGFQYASEFFYKEINHESSI